MTDIELKDGERVNQLFSSDVKIIQNREVFSYSVDSVLLSRFPKLPKRGIDRGSLRRKWGRGTICKYSDRGPDHWCRNIRERLADMATRSIALNGLNQQMSMITDDLKHLPQHIKGGVRWILSSAILLISRWMSIPISMRVNTTS